MKARHAPEGPEWVARDSGFELPVLLADLPKEVPFGFLGQVLPTTENLAMRIEIHRIERSRSLALVEGAGAVAEAELSDGSPSEGARTAELELEAGNAQELAGRLASGEQELFRVGLTLRARAPTRSRAERLRSLLLERLRSFGFRARVPVYETADVLAPPDPSGRVRRPAGFWHTLPTDGVAAFFPFVDESVVEEGGVLVGLLLEDASPVLLDRWRHASHSWGIFGATGSGKSFAASLLALRTRWARPDVELYLLDPLGEFSGLSERLGGQTIRVAGSEGGRVNPLDGGPSNADPAENAAGFGAALRALFPSLTDPEGAALDVAVTALRRPQGPAPTLSDLYDEVRRTRPSEERLLGLLDVFRTGSLRHLDGPTTLTWERSPIVFDLTGLAEAHLPFHLAYLLDVLYARLRSSSNPKLVVVDEAHLLARHPATSEFLDRLVRHVRHYRAGLLLVSQNPDDFLGSESGRSLLRNLRASLLLRLPEVSETTRRFFGLTDAETEWLPRARLPKEAGYSEGLLRFGPSHLPIAVVASTPEYELLTSALRGPEVDPVPREPAERTTRTASL